MRSIARTVLIYMFACAISLAAAPSGIAEQRPATETEVSAEIQYLEQVNTWQAVRDPQLLFILMAAYANAGQQELGIAFFEGMIKKYDAELSPAHRAPTSSRSHRLEPAKLTRSSCFAASAGCATRWR